MRVADGLEGWNWLGVLVAVSVAVAFALAISPFWDIGWLLCTFVLVPVISLITAVYALKARRLAVAVAPVILCSIAWLVWQAGYDCRVYSRWWSEGWYWKAAVLRQPETTGSLKHVDWDGWGFAGEDTQVYLAYDPQDALSQPARRKTSGKVAGIPCPVWRVRRLEKSWYAVTLYTNTDWSHCPKPDGDPDQT